LSATDRFARKFFTEYINLKKSGAFIDEQTGINIVNQLLAQDYGSPVEEKIYIETDITVLNTSALTVLRQYGNDLGAIIDAPFPKGYEQELTVINRVNETDNTDDLSKLSLNIKRYKDMRDKILALPVPNALKTAHLALINSISAMLEGVKGMVIIKTDPVGATKMIARYEGGLNSIEFPFKEIAAYLKKRGISFSSSESGYILMR
jgi:hypothetical protein